VVLGVLRPPGPLQGKRVLVTAGPTVEDIDPVRYISNRSSGKMGYAMAGEAARRGAKVDLISGPTAIDVPTGVSLTRVRSASQMAEAVLARYADVNIVVKTAAVADFTPARAHLQKRKKKERHWSLELVPTLDILEELGRTKKKQFLIGFAAESERLRENARQKLESKSLDLIVANDISDGELGFEVDLNQVLLIDREGNEEQLQPLTKTQIAAKVWDKIERLLSDIAQPVKRNP
jgi:phosphopantothenoylcysteine decarboxylase/phosphopantothenate--cysteine ligase